MRKERLGKFRLAAGFEPWPLRYRCSALRGQDKIPASLNFFQAFSYRNCISCVFKCDDLVCMDLSRIPVNKGIKSMLGWRKCSDLYEIVHPSLHLISFCLLTGADCGKGLFKFFPVFTLIFGEPSLSFRKHREKSLRLTDSLVRLIQVSLNIDIVDNYFPRL